MCTHRRADNTHNNIFQYIKLIIDILFQQKRYHSLNTVVITYKVVLANYGTSYANFNIRRSCFIVYFIFVVVVVSFCVLLLLCGSFIYVPHISHREREKKSSSLELSLSNIRSKSVVHITIKIKSLAKSRNKTHTKQIEKKRTANF